MRKTILLVFITSFLFSFEIEVEIKGLNLNSGEVFIALYANSKNFLSEKNYYKSKIKKTVTSELKYTFSNIPKGVYAVATFCDKNLNGKLDKNFFGIPKESFGISNNPKIIFSQPTFKESSFILDSDKKIEIQIRH